jgi:hypothetical protein
VIIREVGEPTLALAENKTTLRGEGFQPVHALAPLSGFMEGK